MDDDHIDQESPASAKPKHQHVAVEQTPPDQQLLEDIEALLVKIQKLRQLHGSIYDRFVKSQREELARLERVTTGLAGTQNGTQLVEDPPKEEDDASDRHTDSDKSIRLFRCNDRHCVACHRRASSTDGHISNIVDGVAPRVNIISRLVIRVPWWLLKFHVTKSVLWECAASYGRYEIADFMFGVRGRFWFVLVTVLAALIHHPQVQQLLRMTDEVSYRSRGLGLFSGSLRRYSETVVWSELIDRLVDEKLEKVLIMCILFAMVWWSRDC